MFQQDLLKERIIVVTGGSTGLGLSMTKRLLELSAKVVVLSRNEERIKKVCHELNQKFPQRVFGFGLDVRDPNKVTEIVDIVQEKVGTVDSLINAAAGNFLCASEDLSPNAFRSVVEIVLFGTFHCSQAFGKQMIKQKKGNILNIVATYTTSGSAFVLPSAVSKTGVLTMTRSLAIEWATYGIRVNAIAPGIFPTEGAFSRLIPKGLNFEETLKKQIPDDRFGDPEELANLAAYLLSNQSGHITGEVVTMDGGESLMASHFNFLTLLDRKKLKEALQKIRTASS